MFYKLTLLPFKNLDEESLTVGYKLNEILESDLQDAILTPSHQQDYKSKTYRVTNNIEIPIPVGGKQTQQGSAWWLNKKEFKKNCNTLVQ